jgi:pimeloyl-ACP methyl ester carboxylesterase
MGDLASAYHPLSTHLTNAGYRVAIIHLRGHGESSTNFTRYGDEAIADDFLAVMSELGAEKAVLVGASMSAGAATIAAGKAPEKVAGVVLCGPFLRNPVSGFGGAVIRGIMGVALYRPWGPWIWKVYAATLWPGLGDKAKERAVESTKMLSEPGRWVAFHATVMGANHDAVTPWLGKARGTKVLVVMGEKDVDFPKPKEEMEWVASCFEDHEVLLVEGVGHAPMLEGVDVVGPRVVEWLKWIGY